MAEFIDEGPGRCEGCKFRCGWNSERYCNVRRRGFICPVVETIIMPHYHLLDRGWEQGFIRNMRNWSSWISKDQASKINAIGDREANRHIPSPRRKRVSEVITDLATKLGIAVGVIVRYPDKSGRRNLGEVDWVDGEKFHTLILHSGPRNGHTLNMNTDKFEVIGGGKS